MGADLIVAAAALISAFQTVASRNVDPMSESVVSITRVQSGSTWNIIPGEAQLEGTARSFDEVTRGLIQRRLGEIAEGIGTAYGVKISFQWFPGNPPTNNDSDLVDFVRKTALGLGYSVEPAVASMGGEDFAEFQQKIPGVIWQIGVGSQHFLHHPGFTADTTVLSKAACFLAALGEQILIEKK